MQKKISIQVLPEEANSEEAVKKYVALSCGISPSNVQGYYILRESIDARSKQVKINLTPYRHLSMNPSRKGLS